jgi:NAD(P)-dependent dehydrogenase (short-subunit alcohol dehydrogenase family)
LRRFVFQDARLGWIYAICPGYFPTKLSAGLAERADEIAKVTPLGRAGGDYDIKGPVVFFASEASRHVSGQAGWSAESDFRSPDVASSSSGYLVGSRRR